ncbi:hypothetical protein AAKU55_000898 [Oxalobacteraceae bacterium GrIS 1.11]
MHLVEHIHYRNHHSENYSRALRSIGVFLIILGEVISLQCLDGAYSSGFGGHPDEAAHFVSALMVRDFLGHIGAVAPVEFAQSFYLHYPKVAIGNWPPLMYALSGIWFLVFGATRASALAFIALVVAATATAIYAIGRKLLSPFAGLFAAALYVALPLVQESSAMFMTEHLVTLLILLSAIQFARFAETQKTLDALLFGMLASAAILTRGSAWALLLVPPFVIALTRNWRLLLNWRLWLVALPVVFLCVPWYIYAKGMSRGAMTGIDPTAPMAFFTSAMLAFPTFVGRAAGPILCALAALGIWQTIRARQYASHWSALLALIIGILLIQSIVPASIEQRFMVQLLPSLLLFAGAGAHWLIRKLLPTTNTRPLPATAAWLATAALIMLTIFNLPNRIRNSGYAEVASALRDGARGINSPVIFLSSDPVGEGSVVAAIAAANAASDPVCLRGSKILVEEDWLGRGSRDRFPTEEELHTLLDAIPVDAVMVDEAIVEQWQRPYHERLGKLLRRDTRNWRLGAAFRVVRHGQSYPAAVRVYLRRRPYDKQLPSTTNMALIGKLMQRN